MSILNRIYSDYFLPSRLGEYEKLLAIAVKENYQHLTIPEFYALAKSNSLHGKYFIHRHDIDTDVSTARELFLIEKKLSVKTSFYFRLNTIDVPLMNEIRNYGSEVGYHFEELSDFCKTNKIKSAEEAKKHYDTIRKLFAENFLALEKKCGFKIKTIASHGDFVNREIGVSNFDFITRELMDQLKIDFECYDELLIRNYGTILSDTGYPEFYKQGNPFDAIKKNDQRIYLLTHPRHWRKAIIENTSDNLTRFFQGLKYKR
jgi:hypothetical protein